MTFGILSSDSLQDLCEIERQCFGKDAWNFNMLESEFKSGSVFFGAKDGNKVVGYVCAKTILDEADINNVAVLPEYRRQGIAQKLINCLISYCKTNGIYKFTLEVNANNSAAKNLYKKTGFETAGVRKGYYHGEDAEIMWLSVN